MGRGLCGDVCCLGTNGLGGKECARLWQTGQAARAQILSMDGYGTDAYLHLNRLGNVQEPLP